MPMRFITDAGDAGKRLDRALHERLPSFSRARIQEWIRAGRALVEGAPARPSRAMRPGETIEVEPADPTPLRAEPEDIPLAILYEDDDVAAVNKPAGMVVHAGAGVHAGTLVNAAALKEDGFVRVVAGGRTVDLSVTGKISVPYVSANTIWLVTGGGTVKTPAAHSNFPEGANSVVKVGGNSTFIFNHYQALAYSGDEGIVHAFVYVDAFDREADLTGGSHRAAQRCGD